MLLCTGGACVGQEMAYNEQAELDAEGRIFVSSEGGKLIVMADSKRCGEVREAEDRQTMGCLVIQSPEVGIAQPQLRLEIYLKGGQKRVLEPGGPILEWHFWESGRRVELFFGEEPRKGTHVLYDVATAEVIEKVMEQAEESQLPQWAKGPGEIQDESVAQSDALAEERTKWVAKVLRRIGNIQPGMTREELSKVFTTEGGLSSRLQRTYVLAECPYIKVDVRFKAANDEGNWEKEEPRDVIESISRPYMAWSTKD